MDASKPTRPATLAEWNAQQRGEVKTPTRPATLAEFKAQQGKGDDD